jgi:hypothetical protein
MLSNPYASPRSQSHNSINKFKSPSVFFRSTPCPSSFGDGHFALLVIPHHTPQLPHVGKNRFLSCFASFSRLHSIHYPYSLVFHPSFFVLLHSQKDPHHSYPVPVPHPMSVCGLRLFVAWRSAARRFGRTDGRFWTGLVLGSDSLDDRSTDCSVFFFTTVFAALMRQ